MEENVRADRLRKRIEPRLARILRQRPRPTLERMELYPRPEPDELPHQLPSMPVVPGRAAIRPDDLDGF